MQRGLDKANVIDLVAGTPSNGDGSHRRRSSRATTATPANFDQKYHPMDSVTRPKARATLRHAPLSPDDDLDMTFVALSDSPAPSTTRRRSTRSRTPAAKRKIDQKWHPLDAYLDSDPPAKRKRTKEDVGDERSSQAASFHADDSTDSEIVKDESELGVHGQHLLKRDFFPVWKLLEPLDQRLYVLQSGLPDSGILPRSWRSVTDKLIREKWFTQAEFRKWGGETALRKRYDLLREHIQGDAAAEEPTRRRDWNVKWAEDFNVFLLKPGEEYRELRNLPRIEKVTEQNTLVFADDDEEAEELEGDTILVEGAPPSSPTVGDRSRANSPAQQDKSSADEQSPVRATNKNAPITVSSDKDSSSDESSSEECSSVLASVVRASASFAKRGESHAVDNPPPSLTLTRKRPLICSDTEDEPSDEDKDEDDEQAVDNTLADMLDDLSQEYRTDIPADSFELPAAESIQESGSGQKEFAREPASLSDRSERLHAGSSSTDHQSSDENEDQAAKAMLDGLLDDISEQCKSDGLDEDAGLPNATSFITTPPKENATQSEPATSLTRLSDYTTPSPVAKPPTRTTRFLSEPYGRAAFQAATAFMTPPLTARRSAAIDTAPPRRASSMTAAVFHIHEDEREPSRGPRWPGAAPLWASQDDKENVERTEEEDAQESSEHELPDVRPSYDERVLISIAQAASDESEM